MNKNKEKMQKLQECIKLIEKLTNKKVILKENSNEKFPTKFFCNLSQIDKLQYLQNEMDMDAGGEELFYFIMWYFGLNGKQTYDLMVEYSLFDPEEIEMYEKYIPLKKCPSNYEKSFREGEIGSNIHKELSVPYNESNINMENNKMNTNTNKLTKKDLVIAAKIIGKFMGEIENQEHMSIKEYEFLKLKFGIFAGILYKGKMYRILYIKTNAQIDNRSNGKIISFSKTENGVYNYSNKYNDPESDEDEENGDVDYEHKYKGYYEITIEQDGEGIILLPILKLIEKYLGNIELENGNLSDYIYDAKNLEEIAGIGLSKFKIINKNKIQ